MLGASGARVAFAAVCIAPQPATGSQLRLNVPCRRCRWQHPVFSGRRVIACCQAWRSYWPLEERRSFPLTFPPAFSDVDPARGGLGAEATAMEATRCCAATRKLPAFLKNDFGVAVDQVDERLTRMARSPELRGHLEVVRLILASSWRRKCSVCALRGVAFWKRVVCG